jgi:hypothetical protein
MIKQKTLIGTEIDNTSKLIERGMINNLNRSLGKDVDKITTSSVNAEYLPAFLLGHVINMHQVYKILSLGVNQVLLSRESVTAHKPIKIGDVVKVRTFLQDVYEQQATSNPIGFVILNSVGTINDDTAFYCERILAVRGGFNRGH